MPRMITYPSVPEAHRHVQEFLMDTLKDRYYQRQSLRNLGLALIKFFNIWAWREERYHVKISAQGDEGIVEVFYQEAGEDKTVIIKITQGGKNDNCN